MENYESKQIELRNAAVKLEIDARYSKRIIAEHLNDFRKIRNDYIAINGKGSTAVLDNMIARATVGRFFGGIAQCIHLDKDTIGRV